MIVPLFPRAVDSPPRPLAGLFPASYETSQAAGETQIARGLGAATRGSLPLKGFAPRARQLSILICAAGQLSLAAAAGPAAAASTDAATATVQGKLQAGPQGALRVVTPAGAVALTSSDPSILHTLDDPRMNGREVRLTGRPDHSPTDRLDVAHVLTVRNGKVYRLRFYCHVCNIPATEPGPCVCCQRWTELEEIPVDQVTDDMVLVP
jgi:hypothetical protein